jgi:hypothetical protein
VDFVKKGYDKFNFLFDQTKCNNLLEKIKKTRDFGPNLFLSEEEFNKNPIYKGVNPRPGRNICETLKEDISFITEDERFKLMLSKILGEDYKYLHHKVVCSVPNTWLPDWLIKKIDGTPAKNLGAYVKPEYRDVTYFQGIDYHQDIIDRPGRESDFITIYVYLHDVNDYNSPIHVLEGSHILGATEFPHSLRRGSGDNWDYFYKDMTKNCKNIKLTAPAGSCFYWHCATLHGTQPNTGDNERISLRLMYSKFNKSSKGLIDDVNNEIEGALSIFKTRTDLDKKGEAKIKSNKINGES